MTIFEPLRRGAEDFADALGVGWQWLRERSASALTRFRRNEESDAESATLPAGFDTESWGLLASEIAETDDEVLIRVEAPGLEEKDFSVTVQNGRLRIRGEKRFEREDRQAHYHLFESAYGAFERRFPLPCEVDPDRAEARYRNGVLKVRLPRTDGARRRRIHVNA